MPANFFDTNVLMYIASGEPQKADLAEGIVRGGGVISVQVLNEITNVARRRMRMSWSEDMQNGMTIDGRLRIANPFH